jgi:hypothetical protein
VTVEDDLDWYISMAFEWRDAPCSTREDSLAGVTGGSAVDDPESAGKS